MINIEHAKVVTKPPVNKIFSGKKPIRKGKIVENEKKFKEDMISGISDKEHSEIIECLDCSEQDDLRSDAGSRIAKKYVGSTSDCNQNIIESEASSFEQFCNIINDLEQTLSNHEEVISIGTCCFPTENNPENVHITPEPDDSAAISTGSAYDDIISFLNTLEQHIDIPTAIDDLENDENIFESRSDEQKLSMINKNMLYENAKIKDELETALIQLEDRNASIKILKEELKSERQAACVKLDGQKSEHIDELKKQKTKYQNMVKRHQKFIEQLIEEKKNLTENCNSLTQAFKDLEVKQQKDLKMAVQKQMFEIQRTKQFCMASEKIKRERWIESKTSKIKEMTVKGLEPELRNMINQHQQEIQDIRSAHIKELQEVELRVIRRSNQQLEQLRIELTESHNKIWSSEKDAIKQRFEEKFDQQESLLQSQQRKFFDDLEAEKRKFVEELARRNADNDESINQILNKNKRKIDAMLKEFDEEKKLLKENLKSEKNAWLENYKSQQKAKMEMAETKIRDECNHDRDRQIELVIARLERETRDMKNNLQTSFDKKMELLKEKYESELEVCKDNEKVVKEKLKVALEKIDLLVMDLRKADNSIAKYSTDLNESNRLLDKVTREWDHAKKLARQEIECEKKDLENTIVLLQKEIHQINVNRDTRIAQLYSRIKLIITQKDMSIKNITRESNDVKNKCEHLEKLLNQQRKDYILKNL